MAAKMLLIEDDASFRKAVGDVLTLGWESEQWLVSVSGRGYALIPPK